MKNDDGSETKLQRPTSSAPFVRPTSSTPSFRPHLPSVRPSENRETRSRCLVSPYLLIAVAKPSPVHHCHLNAGYCLLSITPVASSTESSNRLIPHPLILSFCWRKESRTFDRSRRGNHCSNGVRCQLRCHHHAHRKPHSPPPIVIALSSLTCRSLSCMPDSDLIFFKHPNQSGLCGFWIMELGFEFQNGVLEVGF